MKTDTYNTIVEDLYSILDKCHRLLDNVVSVDDLENLTIKEFNQLITDSRYLQSVMSTVLIDQYHILGMGNLNAVQMAKFSSLLNQIMQYRSDVKRLATLSPVKVSYIPTVSEYKLQTIGAGITLTSTPRGGNVTPEVVSLNEEDTEEECIPVKMYNYPGKTTVAKLRIREDKLVPFFKAYANEFDVEYSGQWITAIKQEKSIFGTDWVKRGIYFEADTFNGSILKLKNVVELFNRV